MSSLCVCFYESMNQYVATVFLSELNYEPNGLSFEERPITVGRRTESLESLFQI